MNINKKLAAVFLVTACALSTQVNAQQTAVEQIVHNFVKSAVNNVSIEIDHQVQKLTLSASNIMSLDAADAPAGKVTITDLAASPTKADTKEYAKSANQNENSDD